MRPRRGGDTASCVRRATTILRTRGINSDMAISPVDQHIGCAVYCRLGRKQRWIMTRSVKIAERTVLSLGDHSDKKPKNEAWLKLGSLTPKLVHRVLKASVGLRRQYPKLPGTMVSSFARLGC